MIEMQRCTVQELQNELLGGGSCHVIDVRESAEYATEYVAGTHLLPLSNFANHARTVPADRPVYVLCRSGNRAKQAALQLAQLGLQNIHVVEGGIQAWAAAGLPIERGQRQVWALDRQMRFLAGLLVVTGLTLAITVHPWFAALSGLIGAGLMFAALTDSCPMTMVLARMPWNQQSQPAVCAPPQA